MRIFLRKVLANKILLMIFLLGISLRIINPTFGLPTLYISGDEPPNYMGALNMIINKTPFVTTSIYPPLGSYIQIPFLILAALTMIIFGKMQNFAELKLFMLTNQGYLLFVPRIISGILGSLTLLVLYKIARLLFSKDKFIPLLSVFLFATSFNHGQVSHSGRVWAPALFFFSLAVYYSLKSINYQPHERKNSILAGLFSGITFGFHQVGVFAVWFLILTRLFKSREKMHKTLFDTNTLFGVIVAFIGMAIFQFLRLSAPTAKWFALNTKEYTSIFGKFVTILVDNNLFYNLRQIIVMEPVIFVFFLISFLSYKIWKRPLLPITLFIITTFIVFSISFVQPRYMLPVILLMSIYAASLLKEWLYKIKKLSLKFVFISIVILVTSYNLVIWNILYLQEPTFMQAAHWIEDNIKANEIIVSTALRFMPYAPAKDVLSLQQVRHPYFYESAGKILKVGQYPENVRNIIYLGEAGDIHTRENVPILLNNLIISPKFVMDIYFDPNDTPLAEVNKDKYIKRKSFSPLKDKTTMIRIDNVFSTVDEPPLPLLLTMLERTGPYVDIYEVKSKK